MAILPILTNNGHAYVEKSYELVCCFAKSLGCRIVDAGIEPPEGLRRLLTHTGHNDIKPLVVTFGINDFWRRIDPAGRVMGSDFFDSWPEITDRQCFSWVEMLGYLEIFYWYDLEWEDGYPFGGEPMYGSNRRVGLGRYDPLPGEPAASMMRDSLSGDLS